ncbi:putative phage abortive infection protein [Aeromonas sp. SG16]|uniref:putative phage abortive infection protein n=1 Tax=Aeromonas sp. SG16 TaxID=2950548 RepID=UPI00210BFC22|nr:putative phage abortive infection protein [Aeromonas sp. SG16]MCQ4053337.1 putative phage abortive infection protein [Aeromonas sp. SG16]
MSNKNNPDNGSLKGWCFIIFVLVFVLVLWSIYPIWSYWFKNIFYNARFVEMGVFGDSFGALNTLFSAFAFIGIIASIFFQSQELELNREELKRTRAEFETQGEQFKQQTMALNKQVFENTFFQLVVMSNKVKDSIVNGHDFKKAYETFISREYRTQSGNSRLDEIELYLKLHNEFAGSLGLYYRNVYQILKFIDESSNISSQDKKSYSNYLRAQLSQYELYFLFYNCLSELGNEKFKPYIEKYEFLEHLSKTLWIPFGYIDKYNVTVFGTSNTNFLEQYFDALTKEWWKKFWESGEKGMICVRDRNGNLYKIESKEEYYNIRKRVKNGEAIISDVIHNSFQVE